METNLNVERLLETAIDAARAGSRALEPFFRQDDLAVRLKNANDLVSEADNASEEAICAVIRERHPDHHILAEEGGRHPGGPEAELEWVLDPLDGTTNFVHGHPVWAVSVACLHRGRPIVGVVEDPTGGNLFAAAQGSGTVWNGRPVRVAPRDGLDGTFLATGFPFKAHPALDLYLDLFRAVFPRVSGIRRCGAAALDLAFVAAGVYDGFFELRLAPWDLAAGVVLVREAGGVATDLDGHDDLLRGGNVVAGSEKLHLELRKLIHQFASEAAIDRLVPVGADVPNSYTDMQEGANTSGC